MGRGGRRREDIQSESRNAEMFSLTHELSYYHVRAGHLLDSTTLSWKGLAIVFEKYWQPCKINPLEKTNKPKADDKENDEHVTGRPEGFFFEPERGQRFLSVIISKILGIRLGNVSIIFATRRSLKEKESSRRKECLVAVIIVVQHQAIRKMNLKLHRRREGFTEDDGWDLIIEQRVKVNQKERILELKQRNYEEHYSDIPYAVSTEEDMAYPCPKLHSTSTMRRLAVYRRNPYAILDYK
ncbi:hypothetical protein Tco_0706458 [Tanacetum coccineum]|uniref:Uncharacterized protein n=1 Tax=Tanacetum coccineum TaxID=301880 RepID=A0ABQ4Y9P9_9ASTR